MRETSIPKSDARIPKKSLLPCYNATMNDERQPGCLHYGLLVAAGLWIIAATFFIHIVAWTTGQYLLYEETPLPAFTWVLISWGHGLALAVPVLLLALFTQVPRLRAAYQTWLLVIVFIFLLALVRTFSTMQTQPAALAQILLTLPATAALWLFARARGRALHPPIASVTLLALALAGIVLIPSVAWGALGSRLDTLLDLLASLALGLFAGVLLDAFYLHSIGSDGSLLVDAWVAALALLILGSGFGFDGSQLLLMLALPPLGFMAAALARMSQVRQ